MNKYFFDEQTADGMRPIVKDEKHTRTYELQKILGTGASCVVYVAKESGRSCLIKEFNPKYGNITRNDNGELICEDERTKLLFDDGLSRFKEACEKQNEFRNNSELKNYISPVVSGFEGNNTYYSEIVDFNGTDYSQYTDKTLKELLERVRALTKVIGIYHKDGYLHLDIKPENIFVLEEAEKLPILIDFDSITTKDEIELTRVSSYSEEWAAAEQKDINSFVRKVCPATDLFAIGEILFYKLFNRHSTRFERRSFSSFEFNREEGLLKDIDHKIFPLLKEIFNHTICTYIGSRYQTAEELIEKLDKAIELADPKRAFLPACNLNTKDFFVGRNKELAEIEQKLKECDELYVSGFGGIGKSELVRQYAKIHKSEFDSIVFITFNIDLKSMLDNINIVNFASIENETIDNRLQHILNKLQEFKKNGEKILFVVDNFNTELDDEENKLFGKFISCAEKTIVTTRNTDVNGKTMVSIGAVENPREIFDNYYTGLLSEAEDKAVNGILDIFQGHTLATELLAKQMKASRIVPSKMFGILESKGLRKSGNEKVKYGNKKNNAYNFIKDIFNITGLTDEQIYVLVNLSLIPSSGVLAENFLNFCELDSYDNINNLILLGWIEQNKNTDFISLHPLIAEIMFEKLDSDFDKCLVLLKNIKEIANNETVASFEKLHLIMDYTSEVLFRLGKLDTIVVEFWLQNAVVFHKYGNVDRNILRLERFIEVEKRTSKLKANAINELGTLYAAIDDLEMSEYYYLMSVEMHIEISGLEGYDLATVYNNLGTLYDKKGILLKTEEYYKKALEIYIKRLGEKGQGTLICYNNLGANLVAQGKYEEAEAIYERIYDDFVEVFGLTHRRIAVLFSNMGQICIQFHKNYTLGIKYFEKAINIWQCKYGSNYELVAKTKVNLGVSYREAGEFEKAIGMLCDAENIFNKIYNSNNHSSFAVIYSALGKTYELDKQYDMAKECYLKSIAIRKEIFKPDHPKVKLVEERLKNLEKLIAEEN